jgi:hypothetical protein
MRGDIVFHKHFYFMAFLFFIVFNGLYAQGGKEMENGNSTITKSFGSFELPNDWIESSKSPGSGKYFYVHKTERNADLPTNISVEMGTNPYSRDNPLPFGQAIQRQLIMQTGGQAKIDGGGTFTEQGYPLIYFSIQAPQATTTQFYSALS